MKGHVPVEVLVDLAEGAGTKPEREHVSACAECRLALDGLRGELGALRECDVPEPSPLYWEAFRRQVGRRVQDEARPRSWRLWLAPALATGLAVAAFVGRAPSPRPQPAATLPAWSALPPSEDDAGLAVLQALAEGGQLSASSCGAVEDCLAGLSDEDASALAEALRGELPAERQL